MKRIIIWVTDNSTGEDSTIKLEVKAANIEAQVESWIASHPEYEVSGWDYQ